METYYNIADSDDITESIKKIFKPPITRKTLLNLTPLPESSKLLFLPSCVNEYDIQLETYDKANYRIFLFGILLNGERATVILNNIKPYFEILLPDYITHEYIKNNKTNFNAYIANVTQTIKPITISKYKAESFNPIVSLQFITAYKYKYYNRFKSGFLRLSFDKLKHRNDAIAILNKNKDIDDNDFILYTNDSTKDYYKIFSRDTDISLSSWCEISEIKKFHNPDLINTNSHIFIINAPETNFKNYPNENLTIDMIQNKTLTNSWDTEVYSDTGLPNPLVDSNRIFSLSSTYQFASEKSTKVNFIFCDYDAEPDPDFITIICGNEKNILEAYSAVHSIFEPEIIYGFNDSDFDWPWFVHRALCYPGLLKKIYSNMSSIKFKEYNTPVTDEYVYSRFFKIEQIKITADLTIKAKFLEFPGFLPIDIRTIFRKLNPTAEKSSLNWYLSKSGLESKDDMPISLLFEIYKNYSDSQGNKRSVPKIQDAIKIIEKKFRDDDFNGFKSSEESEESDDDESEDNTKKTILDPILDPNFQHKKLLKDINKYCVIDSIRSHELICKNLAIIDNREFSGITFVSLRDSFYRANGMKIFNTTVNIGQKPPFCMRFNTSNKYASNASTGKYEGALVLQPIKGLNAPKLTISENVKRVNELKVLKEKIHMFTYDQIIKINTDWEEQKEDNDIILKIIESHGPVINDNTLLDELYTKYKQEKYKTSHVSITPKHYREFFNEKIKRPISGLDFSSLYPSLMRAYNLCPTKLIRTIEEKEEIEKIIELENKFKDSYAIKFITDNLQKFESGEFTFEKNIKFPDISNIKKLRDEFTEISTANKFVNLYFASEFYNFTKSKILEVEYNYNGLQKCYYIWHSNNFDITDPNFKFGLYPYILNTLFNKRKSIKALLNPYVEKKEHLLKESSQNTQELQELEIWINYYNSKQNSIKVFMNTFYGVTGSQTSSLYIRDIACSITALGQKSLLKAKEIVESHGYLVHYGDTDSLYISASDKYFEEYDKLYYSEKITKLDYCTKLVEITMKQMDNIQKIVNQEFKKISHTNFLSMAYEEVLYYVMMLAQKKYFGIEHKSIVNFNVKNIFIRGLEIKKRGTSELLRKVYGDLLNQILDISNIYTIMELICMKYHELYNTKWDLSYFKQSEMYKPEKKNVKIHTLVKRMAEKGIIIKPYERIDTIVCKKYPYNYGYRGTKNIINIGEKLEIYNPETPGNFEIDLDHYVKNSFNTQFARLILYDPKFASTDDKKSLDNAVNFLENNIAKHYYTKWQEFGKFIQTHFKSVNKSIKTKIDYKYTGSNLTSILDPKLIDIENTVEKVIQVKLDFLNGYCISLTENEGYLIGNFEKEAKKYYGKTYCINYIKNVLTLGKDKLNNKYVIELLYKTWGNASAVYRYNCDINIKKLEAQIKELRKFKNLINELYEKYQEVLSKCMTEKMVLLKNLDELKKEIKINESEIPQIIENDETKIEEIEENIEKIINEYVDTKFKYNESFEKVLNKISYIIYSACRIYNIQENINLARSRLNNIIDVKAVKVEVEKGLINDIKGIMPDI